MPHPSAVLFPRGDECTGLADAELLGADVCAVAADFNALGAGGLQGGCIVGVDVVGNADCVAIAAIAEVELDAAVARLG